MIDVRVVRRNSEITGFSVRGHAGYAEAGSDVVCAAVSILLYNAVNSCEKFLDVHLHVRDDGDTFAADVAPADIHRDGVQLLLNSMVFGFRQIAEQYPEHVTVSLKE